MPWTSCAPRGSAPRCNSDAGPRASLASAGSGQALALIDGSEFVTPRHIREMAVPVLEHRLVLDPQARSPESTTQQVVEEVSAPGACPHSPHVADLLPRFPWRRRSPALGERRITAAGVLVFCGIAITGAVGVDTTLSLAFQTFSLSFADRGEPAVRAWVRVRIGAERSCHASPPP